LGKAGRAILLTIKTEQFMKPLDRI